MYHISLSVECDKDYNCVRDLVIENNEVLLLNLDSFVKMP
jgi:hypothetical protein